MQHWPDQLSLLWDGSASQAWWNLLEIGAGIGGTKICFRAVITTTVRNGPMVTTATVITSPIDLMHTHDRKNDGESNRICRAFYDAALQKVVERTFAFVSNPRHLPVTYFAINCKERPG